MSNVENLKKVIRHLLKESDLKRKALLDNDRNVLRSFLRHCIHETILEKKLASKKEELIRRSVRILIRESQAIGGSPESPSDITAINFLKNLLKNIIPSIEQNYKELTSSKKQRISFRRHILNACENLINNLNADPEAVENDELDELNLKIDDDGSGENQEPEGFIDIYGSEEKDSSEEDLDPEQEFAQGLEDRNLDKTGRNAAFEAFKKIQNQIENEYSKLDPDAKVDGREETEREIFEDYLLLNLKLYFDKFEEDLMPDVEEPVTPSEDEYKTADSDEGDKELIPPEEA